jgi:hypothetical protein
MNSIIGFSFMFLFCAIIFIKTYKEDIKLKTFKERNILSKSLSLRVYLITLVGMFISIYLIFKKII